MTVPEVKVTRVLDTRLCQVKFLECLREQGGLNDQAARSATSFQV